MPTRPPEPVVECDRLESDHWILVQVTQVQSKQPGWSLFSPGCATGMGLG